MQEKLEKTLSFVGELLKVSDCTLLSPLESGKGSKISIGIF